MLRPEQKCVKQIKGLSSMFSKAKEPKMNTCTGTLATAEACLHLPENYGIFVWEKNSACFQNALSALVELCANHVLSADDNTTGSDEVVRSSKVFLKEMALLVSKWWFDSSTVLPGLVLVQAFPACLTSLVENVYKDATMFDKCRHIPLPQWSDKCWTAFTGCISSQIWRLMLQLKESRWISQRFFILILVWVCFLSDNREKQGGRLRLWLSDLCKPDQGAANHKGV